MDTPTLIHAIEIKNANNPYMMTFCGLGLEKTVFFNKTASANSARCHVCAGLMKFRQFFRGL